MDKAFGVSSTAETKGLHKKRNGSECRGIEGMGAAGRKQVLRCAQDDKSSE
jgi:hypothetical protein